MPLDNTSWSPDTQVDETTALLVRARGFLERGWCKGYFAYDGHGDQIAARDERAVSWCMVGAIQVAEFGTGNAGCQRARDLLRSTVGESIAKFNDGQETVEPVLAAFDKAIGLIESL